MNWSVDNNGAWDYAADTRGYTVGLVADYEDRNWGFRFAEGLMPKVANGIDLVWRPWQVHAETGSMSCGVAFCRRSPRGAFARVHQLRQYGHLPRCGYAILGSHVPAPETVPDITNHPWHITRKYGFGVNVEQNLARYVTRMRAGDGTTAKPSRCLHRDRFDVQRGCRVNGALWHRTQDRAGIAFGRMESRKIIRYIWRWRPCDFCWATAG